MKRIQMVCAILLFCTIVGNSTLASARTLSVVTTADDRNAIANDWTYYKRGYMDYNCLAYALGNNTTWYWPWGASPTVAQVKSWFKNKCNYTVGAKDKTAGLPTYVVCVYADSNKKVTHFSRTTKINGDSLGASVACVAKWGRCELFTHKTRNPYKANGVYGSLSFIAYSKTQTCASSCPSA